MLKNCAVVGVFWGAYAAREPENFRQDMAELFALVDTSRLKPVISDSFPLARGGEAIRQLADRKVIGKVVVTVGFVTEHEAKYPKAAKALATESD